MEICSAFCGSEFDKVPIETFKDFDAKYFSPVWSPRQWQLLKNKAHQHIAVWAVSRSEITTTLLASYNQFDGTAEIFKIVTVPEFRRQGLAKECFEELCKILVKLDVYKVFLQVEKFNCAAIAAYLSWGFVETRELKNYYGTGRDAAEYLFELE